ncbi:MAG: ATPase [Proteobacteria bacterium]|nr:ATPase [Pseudomonadota bacterium]
MLLADAGTSYIKILDSDSGKLKILSLAEFKDHPVLKANYVTGHNSNLFTEAIFVNELVALARGAKVIIPEKDFTILDIGSRDMKLVKFSDDEFEKCDWNTSCGAMIGFTMELLMKYFNKKPEDIKDTNISFDITCGLLGITKFFDNISKTTSIEEGLSALINGLSKFTWQFAGKPQKLYLSGGISENKVFLNHLQKLVPNLKSLGRTVLIEGLRDIDKKSSGVKNERTFDSVTGNQ